MNIRSIAIYSFLSILLAAPGMRSVLAQGDEEVAVEDNVAVKAQAVFETHCLRCHGPDVQKVPGLNVRDHRSMTVELLEGRTRPYVVIGSPENSSIWEMIEAGDMPPASQPQLSEEEKQAVHDWIASDAPPFPTIDVARPFVSEEMLHEAIRSHLRKVRDEQGRIACKNQRFFSFAHVHNNHNISDEDLRLFKAALSKLVNSLTWEAEIVVPEPVDEYGTLFAVDMRDLGWTEQDHWNKILKDDDDDGPDQGYPYGFKFQDPNNLVTLAEDVRALTGSNLPHRLYVRADWFIAKASRPPLYHELLEIPETLAELDTDLEVERVRDFKNGELIRGGVKQSGVSKQNRLLDRHRSEHGYYWISYDFVRNAGKGNIEQNPLGPDFEDHPFENECFEHDGGEVIFTLPNRMQGYMLVDKDGKRIDNGPVEIVSDSQETSGTSIIVNGLSCMACHKTGMRHFKDVIRGSTPIAGEARQKVVELFPSNERLASRLSRDQQVFMNAMFKATGPTLGVESVEQLQEYTREPIGEVARYYLADLSLKTLAAELGVEDPEQLKLKIQANDSLRDILGSVLNGGVVKRTSWESLEFRSRSDMQEAQTLVDRNKVSLTF